LAMQLAACMHCFPMYSVEKVIDIVSGLGFKAIELSAVRPHIYYPEDYTKEEVRKIRELTRSAGLKVVGLHADDGSAFFSNLTHHNEKVRRWKINNLKTSAELASLLGTNIITTTSGYYCSVGTRKEKAWEWAKQGLSEAAQECANHGVVIALEPCPGTLIADSRDGLLLVEQIGLDNVKVLLDTGHAMMSFHSSWRENGPHPVDSVYELKEHLVYVHLDDNNGVEDEHLVPGTGVIDFEAVLDALRDIKYRGYLSLELAVRDPRAGFKRSRQYLEPLLKS